MTALNLSTQIPSNIATVEELVFWSGTLLAYLNPTLSVLETQNSNQIRAQSSIFRNADQNYCALLRLNIPLDPNVFTDRSKKSWMFASELSNIVIPSSFTSN